MKRNDLASKLGRERRGDGGAEIYAPAPVEAAGPGMIIFVAAEKYAAALQSGVSAAIPPRELSERAKCATLISANPYADFARAMNIFFPPFRPPPGTTPTPRVPPAASIAAKPGTGPH